MYARVQILTINCSSDRGVAGRLNMAEYSDVQFQDPSDDDSKPLLQPSKPANTYNGQLGDYLDEILKKIGFGMFQIIAFCFIGITYIAFIGEALTFAFISIPVMNEWKLSPLLFSSASASTFVGNMIGETFLSYAADHYGRFWPFLISLIFIGILVLASAFSPSFYVFVALRMLASIGIGGVIILAYPTMMEFLPVKRRGNVTLLTSLVVAVGSCIAAGAAWWLVPLDEKWGWRYFIIFTSGPAFIAIVFRIAFFVESPRFLVRTGQLKKAWKTFSIMAKINGKNIDTLISKEQFMKECLLLSKDTSYKDNKSLTATLKQLSYIFKPFLCRQTVCLTLVYSLQVMASYGTNLFLPYNLKLLGVNPYLCSFIAFGAQIPGVLFLAIIFEWPEFGRRNTIRIASLITAILYFLFAFVQNGVSIPVLTVLIYFFLSPMISMTMVYIAESYPTEIRVMAMAFISNITCVLSIGLTFGAGYMAEQSKQYTWLSPVVWGSMFIIQFITALFLKFETRGRNLQDTTDEVNERPSIVPDDHSSIQ